MQQRTAETRLYAIRGAQQEAEQCRADDLAYQHQALSHVSRTFALTIPLLPEALRETVSNAYLLCRIADTIEDDPVMAPATKRQYALRFVDAVAGQADSEQFASELTPLLDPTISPHELNLVRNTTAVLRLTHSFSEPVQRAMVRCIRIMSGGMAAFQMKGSQAGLKDMAEMDQYCYVVAGVVGELLTELFCDHSPAIARQRAGLEQYAIAFGQGLQMTNILKDVWEDRARGVVWLPQAVFDEHGFPLSRLGENDAGYAKGIEQLVGYAHGHLADALDYTLLIPAEETGVRRFCLLALGMAVLTLRNVEGHLDYRSATEVKISRRLVKGTMLASYLGAHSDMLSKLFFNLAGSGMPMIRRPGIRPSSSFV